MAEALALVDCFAAMAWTSLRENFTRPTIQEEKGLHLRQVWHPLLRGRPHGELVPHDLVLDGENHFGLITGPNMAGKTTVMREAAIVQVLAQTGCFVPAEEARLSLCDHIFSRLGASDDILKGQSTFMVEMAEAAEIIRHGTERSMVILDEVGRGTSTYDGLSIAWALLEHLVARIRPLGLFATHYHELTALADDLPGVKNLTMETLAVKGEVRFLYRLKEGSAGQSFGIHVAKLAGLPREILERGQEILERLEGESPKASLPPGGPAPEGKAPRGGEAPVPPEGGDGGRAERAAAARGCQGRVPALPSSGRPPRPRRCPRGAWRRSSGTSGSSTSPGPPPWRPLNKAAQDPEHAPRGLPRPPLGIP